MQHDRSYQPAGTSGAGRARETAAQQAYQRRYYQTVTKPKRRAARTRFGSGLRATMSTRGQFTIPVAVRRQLGLTPGDRVEIRLRGADQFELRQHRPDRSRRSRQGGEAR